MSPLKRPLITDDGQKVLAHCPVIISASRATDIPAYYADWFMYRLEKGYVRWINLYNLHQPYYVSFEDTRAIVFWSKNPRPLLSHLEHLDRMGLVYYFQITLTDYEKEGLEPNLPPLDERIATFIRLSHLIGKHRVVWRFDPVLLTPHLDMQTIISRIWNIGERIAPYTRKFVFSFVDLSYAKVKTQASIWQFRAPTSAEKTEFIENILHMSKRYGLLLASCADEASYHPDIVHNSCIDGELLRQIGQHDPVLIRYLDTHKGKDPGQRPACRCIMSKDIGQYNTCLHGCVYCYATDHEKAQIQAKKHMHNPCADTICGDAVIQEKKPEKFFQSYLE